MTITISRRLLGDALDARLKSQLGAGPDGPAVLVFRGDLVTDEADQPQPIQSGTPTPAPDPSGRVGPYVVHYTGVGTPGPEVDLGEDGDDLIWSPLLHISAGYDADAAQTYDRTFAALYRWVPVVAGYGFGLMKPPPGYDPGPLRRQDTPGMPPRFWTPLQMQVQVTTP